MNRLLIAALGLSLLLPLGCRQKQEDSRKKISRKIREKLRKKLPKVAVEEPYITEFDGQKKRWELWGKRITADPDADKVTYESVKVAFFHNGVHSLEVSASSAVYDTESRALDLNGPVRAAFHASQVRLQAPSLHYDRNTAKVTAKGTITVDSPTGRIEGTDLEADVQGKRLTLKKHVSIDLNLGQIQAGPDISTEY